MSNTKVVIVEGARTPMGGLLGSLSAVAAPELASTAIAAAISIAIIFRTTLFISAIILLLTTYLDYL